ncbi:MAG: adenylate/guanylate cyclase domain-containing protein [Pseudomonadota bacterium]
MTRLRTVISSGWRRIRRRFFAFGPPALALVGLLAWAQTDPSGLMTSLRERTFDSFQRVAPREWVDANVRLIAIDEPSLDAYGRWPWPRDRIAELVDRAADAGALAIAFAILFAEGDDFEADARLADAAARIPVVLSLVMADTPRDEAPGAKATFAFSGPLSADGAIMIPDYLSATAPDTGLLDGAAGLGSITLPADDDGVTRRAPTVQIAQPPRNLEDAEPVLHPSLFVETLRAVDAVSTVQLRVAGGANELDPFGEGRLVAAKVGEQAFFTDATGAALLHFTPPAPKRVISAAQVLDGSATDLQGKILVVGAMAEGLSEARATPIETIDAALLHVEALEQALLPRTEGGGFLRRPDWALGAEMMLAALLGLLVISAGRWATRWQGLIGLSAAGLAVLGSWAIFESARLLIDPVLPVTAAFLVFAVGAASRSVVEEEGRARIRAAFERYLDPEFIRQIEDTPEKLSLGQAEEQEITVMYCDIREFGHLTANFRDDPKGLSRLLTAFLAAMGREIKLQGGAIDKFMGDCVMALWNAPVPRDDHADLACTAARNMRKALKRLNNELAKQGLPPLAMSIGIESGVCVVGNMGTEERFDYTAIGAAATLAARLQAEAARRGVDVLVGPGAKALSNDNLGLAETGAMTPKGWTEQVPIYQLA